MLVYNSGGGRDFQWRSGVHVLRVIEQIKKILQLKVRKI